MVTLSQGAVSVFLCLFQVPYELLNKKFRMVQKTLDREVTHVMTATSDLGACVSRPDATVQEVSSLLHGVAQRLSSLKRKVNQCFVFLGLLSAKSSTIA